MDPMDQHITMMSLLTVSQLLRLEEASFEQEALQRFRLPFGHMKLVLWIQPAFTRRQMSVIELVFPLNLLQPVVVDSIHSKSNICFLLTVISKQSASTFAS